MSSYEQSLQDRIEHLEQALAACEQQLAHAQRLATLGTTAAGLAHEINNLLTPVLAYAQLAQSDPDDLDLLRKTIRKAVVGAESATELASTMLDFSKPGGLDRGVSANVGAAVGRAMRCLVRDPAKDGITCHINIDDDLCVRMQPLALQQVVLNLLLNAIKALQGQPRRRLTIDAERLGSTRAAIHVRDTGPGLPSALRARLFEPFVHAAGASREGHHSGQRPVATAGTGQTGLGLAICHRLVTAARGSIAVETAPERGTTFTITLPIAESNTESSQKAA